MNSQLPSTDTHIVRGCNLHTTYCPTNMQTASSCHSPKYATTGAAVSQGRSTGQEFVGSFPISAALLPLSIHGPSIHSFIHSSILTPGKHVTDARMRVPPRRRICRGSSEGWCSCDAAVTWRDAFPTSLRIKGRTSPCHVWNAPVHSGRGTGKSQAASCAVWGARPRDRRWCRSCRGWGKRREALATSPACACKTRARGVIGVWSIDGGRDGGRKFPLELD